MRMQFFLNKRAKFTFKKVSSGPWLVWQCLITYMHLGRVLGEPGCAWGR